jgi:hypothetical protein
VTPEDNAKARLQKSENIFVFQVFLVLKGGFLLRLGALKRAK